jgi:ApbE superfamily uncharacterized protein (UPF0280 family)
VDSLPLPKIKRHFTLKESDVTVISESDKFIDIAADTLKRERLILEDTIRKFPEFQATFKPYFIEDPPRIIEIMQESTAIYEVGPMAAVAGALADLMQEAMRKRGAKITVVENGGEIIIKSVDDIYIALVSLTTVLKGRMGFLFKGGSAQLGVATSSGTFGHAISFGQADTVTIFADNATYADAAATRVANEVKGSDIEGSIGKALEIADSLDKIRGTFITRGKYVGKSGTIPEIISISDDFEKGFLKSKLDGIIGDDFKLF